MIQVGGYEPCTVTDFEIRRTLPISPWSALGGPGGATSDAGAIKVVGN